MGVLLAVLATLVAPNGALALTIAPSCYAPPVALPITEPFVGPACEYCPGHRGVGYATPLGTAVRAGAAGVVTFAGVVAGTRFVVVRDARGLLATYGSLATARVAADQHVVVGQIVGTSTDRLYFGLRRDETYLDPTDHLGVVRRRPRLVPSSGLPSRPAQRLPLTCRAG